MDQMLTIEAVNELDQQAFVETFGAIFEASPHIALDAWARGPFADRAALIEAFDRAAAELSDEDALALLRAHPVLGARGPMAQASQDELASAGLSDVEQERRERLRVDNARYAERFGFPFIIAVRGLGVDDIAAALATRIDGSPDAERVTAMLQVRKIGALRLEQRVEP
jgi:OHCU decarboxylase